MKTSLKCDNCEVSEVKLWKRHGIFSDDTVLCSICAAKKENVDLNEIAEDGTTIQNHSKTDRIGWFVPAIQDEKGNFYNYFCTPKKAYKSWWKLQTFPKKLSIAI